MTVSAPIDIFIGWDPREAEVADVCAYSILRRTDPGAVRIRYLRLPDLRERGLYTRQCERREGRLWDVISEAPMSTEFAISRFLVPILADSEWALFCDCDFLWQADVRQLIALADPDRALMCVKHEHKPPEERKMDGQAQLLYARKNWSSLVLWNVRHPAHRSLTPEVVNSVPGRDLHRFFWLTDEAIGGLPEGWNWLEGHSSEAVEPKAIHYTRGGPWFTEWAGVAHADRWLAEREAFLASRSGGTPATVR